MNEKILQTDDGFNFAYSYCKDADPKSFFKHFHNGYEILFIMQITEGEYIIENKKYALKPYDMLLIKPTLYHYLNIKAGSDYERIVFNFGSKQFDEKLIEAVFKNQYLSFGKNSDISQCFGLIKNNFGSFDNDSLNRFAKAMLSAVLMLLKNFELSAQQNYIYLDEFNTKVIRYINDNIAQITTLDRLAAELFVSKSTLYHSFKKAMRISIMQYVRNKKVLYADSLIKKGIKPTKAYLMSGFKDYTTFYRCYRGFFKKSPSVDA